MRPNNNFPIKKLEIIKIALDLFIENGYEQTKISAIMKSAQLSKGGMYHYFDSKEAILDAVIEYAISEKLIGFEDKLHAAADTFQKMTIFLDSKILTQSEFATKFSTLTKNQKNTLVQYRVKEFNTLFAVPYLKLIIDFGIKEGVFYTNFPEEAAHVLFFAGDMLFNEIAKLKKSTHQEKQQLISIKIDAFVDLSKKTLEINESDTQKFKQLVANEALRN